MTAQDINTIALISGNSLRLLTTPVHIALMPYVQTEHKGQAALWVTNGCTSMSKPITPMGVDNNMNGILNENISQTAIRIFSTTPTPTKLSKKQNLCLPFFTHLEDDKTFINIT